MSANDPSPSAVEYKSRRAEEGRLAWIHDPALITLCLASVGIVVLAGLVQVSFGSFTMSINQACRSVIDTDEVFYEVDADILLMDPRMLKKYSGWNDADFEEIEANVGPLLGSMIRFPYDGRDPYYMRLTVDRTTLVIAH